MKAKRTIRKMRGYPLTRKLATYQRALAGMTKRLDKIIAEVHDLEFTQKALTVERDSLRAALLQAPSDDVTLDTDAAHTESHNATV